MSVNVPGIGPVPVEWHPAKIPQDAAPGRVARPVIAWVHHRMVGNLEGTIRTFTAGDANRPVSTTFGIGHRAGKLTIAQFVDLRDTAYGNGNYDPSGIWDDMGYPLSAINARTVNTEHEDNGQLPVGDPRRGIVTEDILLTSIALDRLCMSGNVSAIKAAGIRASDAGGTRVITDLHAIKPSRRTILKHFDIAGRLKPYCWNRWAADTVGFPRDRFIAALTGAAPAPEVETMKGWTVPKVPCVADVAAGAWLFADSSMDANPLNVQISTARVMPYYGYLPGPIRVLQYVDEQGVASGRIVFAHDVDVKNARPVPAGDVAAATLAGRRTEWDRQASGAKVALAPKP